MRVTDFPSAFFKRSIKRRGNLITLVIFDETIGKRSDLKTDRNFVRITDTLHSKNLFIVFKLQSFHFAQRRSRHQIRNRSTGRFFALFFHQLRKTRHAGHFFLHFFACNKGSGTDLALQDSFFDQSLNRLTQSHSTNVKFQSKLTFRGDSITDRPHASLNIFFYLVMNLNINRRTHKKSPSIILIIL